MENLASAAAIPANRVAAMTIHDLFSVVRTTVEGHCPDLSQYRRGAFRSFGNAWYSESPPAG